MKTTIAALALVLTLATAARAEWPWDSRAAGSPSPHGSYAPLQKLNPFNTKFDGYDPDVQLFAPADLGSYGCAPDPNEGFYFTYDRLYWYVQEKETQVIPDVAEFNRPYNTDVTWGARYDLGYMLDDKGWLISLTYVNGPNLPLNFASTRSLELMRTWRTVELADGSYFEPMLGVRFIKFDDIFVDLLTGTPNANFKWENYIIGPQAGVRWFQQNGRWILSAEGRFFAGFNYAYATPLDISNENDWVPTTELRVNITYQIYKTFAVNAGYSGLYMARGVHRNLFNPDQNEDVLQHGVNFGLVFNR